MRTPNPLIAPSPTSHTNRSRPAGSGRIASTKRLVSLDIITLIICFPEIPAKQGGSSRGKLADHLGNHQRTKNLAKTASSVKVRNLGKCRETLSDRYGIVEVTG